MATSTVAGPSSGPISSTPNAVLPLESSAANYYDLEKGFPAQLAAAAAEEMQSQAPHQVRNRLHPAQPSSAFEGRSSESEIVNPDSSNPHENLRVFPGIWRRLLDRFSALSRSTAPSQNIEVERGYNQITPEILENYTKGIPQLAALQDSNESFSTYRSFGPYAARLLLHREIELNNLVKQLDNLDKKDFKSDLKYRLTSIEHHEGWDVAQKELLDEIEEKISKYYDSLLKYVQVKSLRRPTSGNSRSVLHWITKYRPLEQGEDDFIFHMDDLVLAQKGPEPRHLQGNRIETWIESLASRNPNSLIDSILETGNEKRKSADRSIHHFSSSRLSTLSDAITVFIAVGLLFIPVALLFLVPMTRPLMTTVALGFVLLFSMTMPVLTRARVQDVLVGTAGYAAVVIMFLGNLNGSPGTK